MTTPTEETHPEPQPDKAPAPALEIPHVGDGPPPDPELYAIAVDLVNIAQRLAAHKDAEPIAAAFIVYSAERFRASLTGEPAPERPSIVDEAIAKATAAASPPPGGHAPLPAVTPTSDALLQSTGDVLGELETIPNPELPQTCGAVYVVNGRAFHDSPCQLPAGHPESPGHRNQNIGWWR